jgi:hypothetical protein
MKKIFLFLFVFSLFGCEKDDICDPAAATTPSLVVEFYDISNPTVLKNVVNLKIKEQTQSGDLGVFNGINKIRLPLKTNGTAVNYSFILNSADVDNDNEDLFNVNYIGQDFFISRACGFKTVFGLNGLNPITINEPAISDTPWIQEIEVVTTSITNEKETHVKIFF